MRPWVLSLMLVVASGQFWDITFTAYPSNVLLHVDTSCKDKAGMLVFLAIDEYEIEPTDTHGQMHKQNTPDGVRCTVLVGTLDEHRHFTQSAIVIQED